MVGNHRTIIWFQSYREQGSGPYSATNRHLWDDEVFTQTIFDTSHVTIMTVPVSSSPDDQKHALFDALLSYRARYSSPVYHNVFWHLRNPIFYGLSAVSFPAPVVGCVVPVFEDFEEDRDHHASRAEAVGSYAEHNDLPFGIVAVRHRAQTLPLETLCYLKHLKRPPHLFRYRFGEEPRGLTEAIFQTFDPEGASTDAAVLPDQSGAMLPHPLLPDVSIYHDSIGADTFASARMCRDIVLALNNREEPITIWIDIGPAVSEFVSSLDPAYCLCFGDACIARPIPDTASDRNDAYVMRPACYLYVEYRGMVYDSFTAFNRTMPLSDYQRQTNATKRYHLTLELGSQSQSSVLVTLAKLMSHAETAERE